MFIIKEMLVESMRRTSLHGYQTVVSAPPDLLRESVPLPPIPSCWPSHMIFVSSLAKSIFCKSCSSSPLMCNQGMRVDWLPSLQSFLQEVAREQSLPLQKIISKGWDFWKKKNHRWRFSKDNFRGSDTKPIDTVTPSPKFLKKKLCGGVHHRQSHRVDYLRTEHWSISKSRQTTLRDRVLAGSRKLSEVQSCVLHSQTTDS